jgi:hypothetical protein
MDGGEGGHTQLIRQRVQLLDQGLQPLDPPLQLPNPLPIRLDILIYHRTQTSALLLFPLLHALFFLGVGGKLTNTPDPRCLVGEQAPGAVGEVLVVVV